MTHRLHCHKRTNKSESKGYSVCTTQTFLFSIFIEIDLNKNYLRHISLQKKVKKSCVNSTLRHKTTQINLRIQVFGRTSDSFYYLFYVIMDL